VGPSALVWTVMWAFASMPTFLYLRERGEALPWPRLLGALAGYWVTALFTPLVLDLVRRLPLERRRWVRHLPALAACLCGLIAIDIVLTQTLRLGLSQLLGDPRWVEPLTRARAWGMGVMTMLAYAEIAAVGHAIHYYRESRGKDLRASRLEAQLAQAQLDVLKMQLQPHFLFNTLHAISSLMHRDVEAADRMITLLSDLLRQSLENVSAAVVPLKQELELLEKYLEIERTRFRDRLAVRIDVDPEALDAPVPNLILQPLVENAVRHGIARRSEAGLIEITACREGATLVLHVRDDGPGLRMVPEVALRRGVGLANTQARLRQTYGPGHGFELRNRAEGGLEVALRIPLEASPIHVPASEASPTARQTDRATGAEAEIGPTAHGTPDPAHGSSV